MVASASPASSRSPTSNAPALPCRWRLCVERRHLRLPRWRFPGRTGRPPPGLPACVVEAVRRGHEGREVPSRCGLCRDRRRIGGLCGDGKHRPRRHGARRHGLVRHRQLAGAPRCARPRDEQGNSVRGRAELVDCRNVLVESDGPRVSVIGLEGRDHRGRWRRGAGDFGAGAQKVGKLGGALNQ
jgi:hypothetical protein